LLLTWELVNQAGVHHVPVVENGHCLGLLSERDLAVEVSRDPFGHSRRLVRELTDGSVPFVTVDTPLPAVAARLLHGGRDAIVVHDGSHRLVGLITVHDLLRVLAGEAAAHEKAEA
jgi:CBS domain-containing protein